MLPIACVEGWSTTQTRTGVRLRDLARMAGAPEPGSAFVQSLEEGGAFNRATLARNQVLDPDSLLALRVNDADLPCTRRRVAERASDAPRGPRRSLGSERTLLHLLLHRTDCQAPCQKPQAA